MEKCNTFVMIIPSPVAGTLVPPVRSQKGAKAPGNCGVWFSPSASADGKGSAHFCFRDFSPREEVRWQINNLQQKIKLYK